MEEERYTRITLRIPRDLHEKLQYESDVSSKSMNAEIISRLEQSFVEKKVAYQDLDSLVNAAIDTRLQKLLNAPGQSIFAKLINVANESLRNPPPGSPFLINTKEVKNASLIKITIKPNDLRDHSQEFIDFVKYGYHDLRADHITIECIDGVPSWLNKALSYFAGYGYPMAIVGSDIPEEIKAALKNVTGSQCPQYSWDDNS